MGPLFLLLILLTVCQDRDEVAESRADRSADAPDQEAWEVTKTVTRNGRLRASIHAPHLKKYDRDRISRMDGGISVTFFGWSGDTLSKLTSMKAEIDEGRRVLTAIDSVVLVY
jgi:hypothetical protein